MIQRVLAVTLTLLAIQATQALAESDMALSATAPEPAGSVQSSYVPAQPMLQQVGEAKLRVLFWDIYYSRLFTESGAYERGQRPLKLEIQYLLDIKSDALVERTRTEWDDQGLSHENQDQWLAALGELWPDVSRNDVLVLEIDEDNRSTFYHNGNRLGVIDDAAFGQQFVDIWLAPTTTRPELRLALIGADG